MALVLADRVQQTGTANTTVSFTLSGSVTGYQSFAVVGNTNTTYYAATDTSGNWEVGIGTYSTTGPTLTRTTILSSSNSGSAVTFPGTVNVFVTYPSEKSVNLDGSGNVSALGTVSSGIWQGTAVAVGYGGTGLTTLTAGYIPYGNGTGAFSSSANMTFNGSTLTTLNTAYTGTLTGGTGIVNLGSGQFYKDASGNVGIGVTSTSGYKVAIGGSGLKNQFINTDANNAYLYTDGSAYLGSTAAFNTVFITNNTERMRIDSSGNVGIGTTSPVTNNARLSLKANGDYDAGLAIGSNSSAANWARLDFQNTNAASPAIIYQDQLGTLAIRTDGAYPITFYTNGSNERMRIDSSGNVGIGTSSPNTKFTVNGNANLTGNLYTPDYGYIGNSGGTFSGINTGFQTLSGGSGYLLALTNGNERMRIDSSGNVGIGNPAANTNDQVGGVRPLIVSKSDSATTIAGSQSSIVIGNSDTTTNNTSQLTFAAITGANTTYFASAAISCIYGARTNGQYATGQLVFSTSSGTNSAPTEKMRIDTSGNLLVGTTSQVGFNGGAGANINANGAFRNGVSGSGDSSAWQRSSTGNYLAFFYGALNSNPSAVGSINTNGTNTTYSTSSDYRLKKDVQPMTGALAKVVALNPVTYTWKANGSSGEGFIAHELQAVVPDAVIGEKDAVDDDGNPIYQGIDTSFLVATLTAALQEAHGLIKDLQVRVNALEAK